MQRARVLGTLTAGAAFAALAVGAGMVAPRIAPAHEHDQWRADALRGAHHHERGGRVHDPRGRRDQDRDLHRRFSGHHHHHPHQPPPEPPEQPQGNPGIANIDSLPNFDLTIDGAGFGSDGAPKSSWVINMIGRSPEVGGTTTIGAPILPVSIDLLDVEGNLRVVDGVPLHLDSAPLVAPVLASPIFQPLAYSSSEEPTQFADAVQRAQFFHRGPASWHTTLAPVARPGRTVAIPFGAYRFALRDDGSCCAFAAIDQRVFDRLLFPQVLGDTTTPLGAAQAEGDITTRDLTVVLLPNTVMYPPGEPNRCCILGFHSYDLEPGDEDNGGLERRYVVAIASWLDADLLPGVGDVSPLSHEVMEAINDPFVGTDGVHNFTPWWQQPSGVCQNKNEVTDVVEDVAGAVFPVATPGMTYHLSNQALLPWFFSDRPSDAIHGAYSYPDESLLTAPAPLLPASCL